MVAPQTPVDPSLVNRQGPIPQSLQHIPAAPMLHGTIASAREKAVPISNSSALMSISCAAESMLDSSGVRFLAMFIPPPWFFQWVPYLGRAIKVALNRGFLDGN